MVDKLPHYLMNKGGVFYFTRHVPADMQMHYSRERIVICLKTRSHAAALKASASIAGKLDDFWLQMRVANMDVPAASLLVKKAVLQSTASHAPTLSEALQKYCTLKGMGKSKLFKASSERAVNYAIQCLEDKPVDTYSSAEAGKFRDWLTNRGLSSSSTKRVFASVRAVINLTLREEGIEKSNPFANTYLPVEERPKRKTIPLHDIREIQRKCLQIQDERRLLIALISDTGVRLSEALGLVWEDINLDHDVPYIDVQPHPWRSLKTSGSKRLLPLVGVALDAVKVMHKQMDSPFLFKSYTSHNGCNGNSCSAALNKWMKQFGEGYVIHSFRHSFRDRLRNAGVQSEVIDRLGGWTAGSVGQGYGEGYSLSVLGEQMRKALIDL